MCVWEGGLLCPLHPLCLFDVFFFLPLPTLPPQERLLWLIDLMEVPSFLPSGALGVLQLGRRQGAVALPLTPLCLHPAQRGDQVLLGVLSPVCQSIRVFRLCSGSNPSSASSLLCDLRK